MQKLDRNKKYGKESFGKLEKGIYRYVENVGIGQGIEEYVSDIFEII